jgi:hypothetical protein
LADTEKALLHKGKMSFPQFPWELLLLRFIISIYSFYQSIRVIEKKAIFRACHETIQKGSGGRIRIFPYTNDEGNF